MRVITGRARGTLLQTPEGKDTRPTSDRAKEGIFNILQNEMSGKRVLDLFGGSGQLAIEALSRGAESAVICDSSPKACKVIRSNVQKTGFSDSATVLECDWKTALKKLSDKKFDIVFLDPPYASELLKMSLFRIFDGGFVSENGIVVCESDGEEPLSNSHANLFRFAKYGRAKITILKNKKAEDGNESDSDRQF
ncbi:MAG: 16S rRNA (guanine(966)-N(2))-methyltransferase RsmD [Clostridia bacterium]|nr:16S rRNA (guanine(966)-N(2))-methyltransferase RsmD [Clostridia bacterium]